MKGTTVNEALELLKPYGAILVAGGNGLSNCIESLNIQELADYHTWVHGGELYLTTLQAFDTIEEIHGLICAFAEAKVAALAVHRLSAIGLSEDLSL
ncbi:PucR family transcriptional regulator ligand-binding domain-containing protein [Desulfosporosinus metallidurans]|uniref:Purine catabolism PurC-like domain-containing protein n=1 Tax=Desulfosporosinus metallidurans TaxID=1888891 RepID=A0A1Q8QP81_9FIRM|nr:PucR family transcriptional regulator ligand-binding domain-containing protein [Desulfosporosinus metallidurans]OLN29149.1 hypothetical protein DSOL_3652 [Desulfosporosinus metallidurans]